MKIVTECPSEHHDIEPWHGCYAPGEEVLQHLVTSEMGVYGIGREYGPVRTRFVGWAQHERSQRYHGGDDSKRFYYGKVWEILEPVEISW